MSYFTKFISEKNLLLAWKRIRTGTNYQYKNYFRNIFSAYDLSLDSNLKNLRLNLRDGSYIPSEPL